MKASNLQEAMRLITLHSDYAFQITDIEDFLAKRGRHKDGKTAVSFVIHIGGQQCSIGCSDDEVTKPVRLMLKALQARLANVREKMSVIGVNPDA